MSYLWYWPAGGWNFDTWRAAQEKRGFSVPASPIKPRSDTLPVLLRQGDTRTTWESERKPLLLRRTAELLGTLSDTPPTKPAWEFLGDALVKSGSPSFTMRRLRYRLTGDEWGYAWLLTPQKRGTKTLPAVIALHQTVPQGKTEPAGIEGIPDMAYGKELAEQGFIVLAPDAVDFGERQSGHSNAFYRSAEQFYAKHPDGSVMAKMVFDTQRAVDLLERMPEVDSRHISCIGHSHGGYGTLFAMLFEPRIRAGVISCGMNLLRADPTPERWWRRTALIPRLGFYEGRMEQVPVDAHHWLALIAPRPLFVSVALNDAIFPKAAPFADALKEVQAAYRLYDAAEALRPHVFNEGHSFPPEARRRAYAMLRREGFTTGGG